MRCPIETPENEKTLLAYSAGRLDAESAALLERHMEGCGVCREFARRQRTVWQALDDWKAAPVSADFNRRLYQRVETEISWWDLLTRPFRPLLVRQGLPVAAAAGVVIMAGFLLNRPAAVQYPAATESAEVESLQPSQVEHAVDQMEVMSEFNQLSQSDRTIPKSDAKI